VIGETLGVYHIHSRLGAGGMGEVYRARDTRLGRDVAVKVLPTVFTTDTERCARFEREARLLASLNHRHIGAIYGIEGPDATTGLRALILELVEGETLAERIARKPLKIAEALDIAGQIADALDAAHEKGIVHRDLKPANVKIAPDGTVKVLDFGIAKAIEEQGAVGPAAVTDLVSQAFVIIGTAAYMSPEQARGGRVDKRTDIWAFGCVLFEMLAGKPAFARETVTDTLARVVDGDPDWSLLPVDVPAGARDLLRRCLEKDVRQRLRDIGDARIAQLAASAPSGVAASARSSWRARLAWLFGGTVVAATAIAAWGLWPAPATPPAPAPSLRRLTDFVGEEEWPAVSPDGKTVAFVARADGVRQIWLRLLTGGTPLQITRDAVDHEEPRWSPDSSSLVYFTRPPTPDSSGTIWEISAFGGEPRRLTSATGSGDVSRDGALAVPRLNGDRIELVTLTRDGKTVRSQLLPGGGEYGSVRWSPNGQWLAFQRLDEVFNQQVVVMPAAGEELSIVARSARSRGYAWLADSSGLVYASSAGSTILYPPTMNLHVVRLDGTGDRPVTFGDISYTQPDVLPSGAIVAARTQLKSDLWRFPVDGTPLENASNGVRITRQTGQVQTASVSPDGREVAYLSDSGGHGNIWISKTDGSGSRQITFEQDPAVSIGVPIWSRTSDEISVIVTRNGETGLYLVRSDGTPLRELVANGIGASWTTDDAWIYYATASAAKQCLQKIEVATGTIQEVRCDEAIAPAVNDPERGGPIYYVRYPNAVRDAEIRRADRADAPSTLLAQIALDRIADHPRQLVPTLSNDGALLAMPLRAGATTNISVLPTAGGPLRPLTDFGDRVVLISRRVAFSPDDRWIYASVADVDSDIVLLDGILR
jgi:Tol biopolymer transport system component